MRLWRFPHVDGSRIGAGLFDHMANVDGEGYYYFCRADAVPFAAEHPRSTGHAAPPTAAPVTLEAAEVRA